MLFIPFIYEDKEEAGKFCKCSQHSLLSGCTKHSLALLWMWVAFSAFCQGWFGHCLDADAATFTYCVWCIQLRDYTGRDASKPETLTGVTAKRRYSDLTEEHGVVGNNGMKLTRNIEEKKGAQIMRPWLLRPWMWIYTRDHKLLPNHRFLPLQWRCPLSRHLSSLCSLFEDFQAFSNCATRRGINIAIQVRNSRKPGGWMEFVIFWELLLLVW